MNFTEKIKEAEKMIDEKKFEEAKSLLKETLSKKNQDSADKELGQIYMNLGLAENGLGNISETINWFEKASCCPLHAGLQLRMRLFINENS